MFLEVEGEDVMEKAIGGEKTSDGVVVGAVGRRG